VTLISNIDAQTRTVIRSGGDFGKALAIVYELSGDKLVEDTWKYARGEEKRMLAVGDKTLLAQSYLLDELTENDDEIEGLLLEAESVVTSRAEKARAYSVLVEYYLFKRQFDDARAVLQKWQNIIDASDASEKNEVGHFFVQASELTQITQAICAD
jgi:hypothetical protein